MRVQSSFHRASTVTATSSPSPGATANIGDQVGKSKARSSVNDRASFVRLLDVIIVGRSGTWDATGRAESLSPPRWKQLVRNIEQIENASGDEIGQIVETRRFLIESRRGR